jgi:toxin ParE1/3/4
MKAVLLHPAAMADVEDAAAFYEREGSPAVAARFVKEIERSAHVMLANPGLGTPRARGRRSFAVSGFPYTIIYREVSEGIRILVVKHDRRRPSYGSART